MPEPLLHATFPYSNADLADVTVRLMLLDPALRRRRWLNSLGVAVFALVFASLLLVLLPTGSATMRWVIPIGCAATASVFFVLQWPRAARAALTRWLQKRNGAGPHTCAVTLGPTGASCVQMGQNLEMAWQDFTTIRLTGDDIEFAGKNILVVRRRAFASDAERERFLASARQLHSRAVTSAR